MTFKKIILNEKSPLQNNMYCMISLISLLLNGIIIEIGMNIDCCGGRTSEVYMALPQRSPVMVELNSLIGACSIV